MDWGMVKKSTKDSSSSINQNLSDAAMNWKINNKLTTWFQDPLRAYSDEEVDHEKDVEGEIDLLGGVLHPGCACLHSKAANEDDSRFRKINNFSSSYMYTLGKEHPSD